VEKQDTGPTTTSRLVQYDMFPKSISNHYINSEGMICVKPSSNL
jgi:hypothetical protein